MDENGGLYFEIQTAHGKAGVRGPQRPMKSPSEKDNAGFRGRSEPPMIRAFFCVTVTMRADFYSIFSGSRTTRTGISLCVIIFFAVLPIKALYRNPWP
jgi:hypothetical protein